MDSVQTNNLPEDTFLGNFSSMLLLRCVTQQIEAVQLPKINSNALVKMQPDCRKWVKVADTLLHCLKDTCSQKSEDVLKWLNDLDALVQTWVTLKDQMKDMRDDRLFNEIDTLHQNVCSIHEFVSLIHYKDVQKTSSETVNDEKCEKASMKEDIIFLSDDDS